MPINIPTDLATAADAVPLFSASQLSKLPGLPLIFADITALNAAVTKERANIANGTPLWLDGQQMSVATEAVEGVSRSWNRTAQHARTVRVRPGLSVTLAADANVVRFATGTPAVGLGANGDVYADWDSGLLWTKGAGAWATTSRIDLANRQMLALSRVLSGSSASLTRDGTGNVTSITIGTRVLTVTYPSGYILITASDGAWARFGVDGSYRVTSVEASPNF